MPVRFTAYPPDQAAIVRVLDEDKPYRIGRAPECELRLDHPSVSRFHAELQSQGAGPDWRLHDTGSKNGLRVDGRSTLTINFTESAWFAVGDVYCWLEFIDAAMATHFRNQTERRRLSSRALSQQRIAPHLDIAELIAQTLDVVLELSGLERGFVLYARNAEPLRIRARHGLTQADLSKAAFSGSAAAVAKALDKRETIVCCDTLDSPWLGLRPSVRLGGIRAVVCIPLQVAAGARGVIYVDSRKAGPAVTELDLELIETVAQHASAAIAAGQLSSQVETMLQAAADLDETAPRWDELHPL